MPEINIYIGDFIEHESDRAVLKHVVDLLSQQNLSAVIFANVNFSNCQIDLIVALSNLTLVIEAKKLSFAFRGSDNGDWEILSPSGWKTHRNYYLQTVNAKHAVRDAMLKFNGNSCLYPDAALVFTSPIQQGSSSFRGNFKAKIIEINELHKVLQGTKSLSWPLDVWRNFAKHYDLKPMRDVAMTINGELQDADRIIAAYITSFLKTYKTSTDNLIQNENISRLLKETKDLLIDKKSLVLRGPSGCGKTLIAHKIAIKSINSHFIPIIIRAKNFEGDFSKLINKEAALLQTPSAQVLLSSILKLEIPILFIVDGYNECSKHLQNDLIRAISAACDKFNARVFITSQNQIFPTELLEIYEKTILRPDKELKISIAQQASTTKLLDSQLVLLNSIESSLEAKLVGEIGSNIRPSMSRYAIFDTFIRKRLEEDATDGIRALSTIAKHLSDNISFFLSIRDLERLAVKENISTTILRQLQNTNLLIQDDDYINFGHELYFNAFAAESIIRSSSNTQNILKALEFPSNEDRKDLIIGAIDDVNLLYSVLSEITDETIIKACFLGQCGQVAYEWAESLYDSLIKKMHNEIENIQFELDDKTWEKVIIVPESLYVWSLQEQAFINVLPHAFIKGKFFDTILALVKTMDNHNTIECERLEKKEGKKLQGLRSGMFACCYCGFGGSSRSAISNVCRLLNNGLLRDQSKCVSENAISRFEDENLSFGQLYILLSLYRYDRLEAPPIARLLPEILRNYWREASYHLRLCLMEAVECSTWKISDSARKSLIEIIEEFPDQRNMGISMATTDALKSLGALQESENKHLEEVRGAIQSILANQQDNNYRAFAYSIWASQIDHLYNDAYYQAWSELSTQEKKILIFMAAQTADRQSFLISLLITELAAFNDLTIVSPILRWIDPSLNDSSMLQQNIGNFVIANIALGRLGYDLNETHLNNDVSDSNQAMSIVGAIFYWLNRIDLSTDERNRECSKRMNIFMKYTHAASIIYEINRANCCFEHHIPNLPGGDCILPFLGIYFSKDLAEICRQALQDPEKQKSYFTYFFEPEDMIKFLLDSLGTWGTPLDIQLIRKWTSQPKVGSHALKTIKRLESIKTKSC